LEEKEMKKQEHKCLFCGTAMRREFGPLEYSITSKWSVTVLDNESLVCPKCGEKEDLIVRALHLEMRIAAEVIKKRNPLSGDELRFLRGLLLLNGREFARSLGISPETLSRYEKGVYRLNQTVDRLARAMASLYLLHHGGPAAEFPPSIEGRPVSIKLTLYLDKKGEYRVADERRAAA
jgi:DNA-binding transcriptional regulator YiaG